MNKAEIRFRRHLVDVMQNRWSVSLHEEKISPGIPDLHYCFPTDDAGRYRVGWLELKALDSPMSPRNKIHVQPSQHQYIRRWHFLMPIHFLIKVVSEIYLIPGSFHDEIPFAMRETDFLSMTSKHFDKDFITQILPDLLKDITRY